MRWVPLMGALAAGALVAVGALAILHRGVYPGVALGSATLGAVLALMVRPAWSALPPWVSRWLDLGVVTVAALVGVVGHGLSFGLSYAVLRAPELLTLSGAAGLLGVSLTGLAYTHTRLAAEVEARQHQLAELERRALESRLSALSAQINPHFLFNTLNALAEVVHRDEDEAEDLITDLAAMMRYALESSSRRVPVADELDVVRRLLRVEQVRLGDRLRWSVEAEDVPGLDVPGLLVQPLVENAVQHGAAGRSEGGSVDVRLVRDGDRVRISITDDGPGLPTTVAAELAGAEPAEARGTGGAGGGLRNAAERVRLAFPDGRLFREPTAVGTRLILDLPYPRPEAAKP
jgi:sensor histidine kinase YesM